MATVLFPLPDRDFDVTEVAVPWKLLVEAGHEPVFATEAGATPACDPLLICHGVLVAARAKQESGRSVLHGLRTTCLPKYMERSALATFWRRGRYLLAKRLIAKLA